MSSKTIAVALIATLSVTWYLLDEDGGAKGIERPSEVGERAPRVVEEAADAPAPTLSATVQAPVPTAASADSATAPPAALSAASAGVDERIAAALASAQAGDVAAAEAGLRAALQAATTSAQAARAGLFLARFSGDPLERRQLLGAALLDGVVVAAEHDEVGRALRELNATPNTSLHPLIRSATYKVRSGDSLWKICNKTLPAELGVTHEVGLIRLVNALRGQSLSVGQELVVPLEAARIVVDAAGHGLALYLGETVVMAYQVGLGKESRTPRGEFTVVVKQENPTWFINGKVIPFGDPENLLGTRWLGFENKPGASGFGIHGTVDPESVGRNESMGCVRLRNPEVEELFDLVPRGVSVAIR